MLYQNVNTPLFDKAGCTSQSIERRGWLGTAGATVTTGT